VSQGHGADPFGQGGLVFRLAFSLIVTSVAAAEVAAIAVGVRRRNAATFRHALLGNSFVLVAPATPVIARADFTF